MDLEDYFIKRVSTVNKFIELPDYKEDVILTSIDILSDLNLDDCILFPDPDGKTTINSVQNGEKLHIEVKGESDIYLRINNRGGELVTEKFSIHRDKVKNLINKNFK